MPKRSLLTRLTGWPMIKVPYRAHWRVMINAHQLILNLIEDNEDGDRWLGPTDREAILCPVISQNKVRKKAAILRIEPVFQIHTLSIPGGMEEWQNCAIYRQVALCLAAVAIDGSASGTVREAAQFCASAAMRTACTVPHSGLPPIGALTFLQWEGAPWPGSR